MTENAPAPTPPAIRVVDLSKRHDNGLLALDALSFEVEAGEVYCLIGAQDSGKTTAVRLLFGLMAPTAGRVEILGVDMRRDPDLGRRRCAYLPSSFAFYGAMTARENLRHLTHLGGLGGVGAERETVAMREVGLPERSFDARVSRLRPGDRQKLAVAVALARQAPVWILDEPLAGLDPKAAADLIELFRMARERGTAILWATQDLFRCKELADRVGILEEGRQVLSYSRRELGEKDLERLYLDYMRGTPGRPASFG